MYWANIQGASVFIYLQWIDEFQVNLCLPQPSLLKFLRYSTILLLPVLLKNSKLCIRYFVSTVKKSSVLKWIKSAFWITSIQCVCFFFPFSFQATGECDGAYSSIKSLFFRLSYMWPLDHFFTWYFKQPLPIDQTDTVLLIGKQSLKIKIGNFLYFMPVFNT